MQSDKDIGVYVTLVFFTLFCAYTGIQFTFNIKSMREQVLGSTRGAGIYYEFLKNLMSSPWYLISFRIAGILCIIIAVALAYLLVTHSGQFL